MMRYFNLNPVRNTSKSWRGISNGVTIIGLVWVVINSVLLCPSVSSRMVRGGEVWIREKRLTVLKNLGNIIDLEKVDLRAGINIETLVKNATQDLPEAEETQSLDEIFEEIRQNGGIEIPKDYDIDIETQVGTINLYRDLKNVRNIPGHDAAARIALELTLLHYLGLKKIIKFYGTVSPRRVYSELKHVSDGDETFLNKEAINIPVSITEWAVLNWRAKERALKNFDTYKGNGGQIYFNRELIDEGKIVNRKLKSTFYALKPEYREKLGWTRMDKILEEAEKLKLPQEVIDELVERIATLSPEDINLKQGRGLGLLFKEMTADILNPAFPMTRDEIFQKIREKGGLEIDPIYDVDIETFIGTVNLYRDLKDVRSISGYDAVAKIAFELTLAHYIGAIKIKSPPKIVSPKTVYNALKKVVCKEAIKIPVSITDWATLNYYAEKRALRDPDTYGGDAGSRRFITELKDEGKITIVDPETIYYSIKPEYRQKLNWRYTYTLSEMELIASSIGLRVDELSRYEVERLSDILQYYPSEKIIEYLNLTGHLGFEVLIESKLSLGDLKRIVEKADSEWQELFIKYLDIDHLKNEVANVLALDDFDQIPADRFPTIEDLQVLKEKIIQYFQKLNDFILSPLIYGPIAGIVKNTQAEVIELLRMISDYGHRQLTPTSRFPLIYGEEATYAYLFNKRTLRLDLQWHKEDGQPAALRWKVRENPEVMVDESRIVFEIIIPADGRGLNFRIHTDRLYQLLPYIVGGQMEVVVWPMFNHTEDWSQFDKFNEYLDLFKKHLKKLYHGGNTNN